MIYMVIIIPDSVFRVICQKNSILDQGGPKQDIFWLSKNNTIFLSSPQILILLTKLNLRFT